MGKKLFIIGSSLNYGSPGKITENIGLLAKSQGWEVYQAHGLKYSNPSQLIARPVSTTLGEKIHAGYSLLLDGHGLASTKSTLKLVEWLKEVRPDVIHLHNLHGYYLNYEVLFNYLSTINTPIVWTLHDFWPITGHCAHFDYAGCYKWKTQCEECPQRGTYPKSLFIDRSKRNFVLKKRIFTSVKNMTIVPVSKWVGGLVSESFLGKYPIIPIYNGIDTDVFKPTASNLRERLGLQDKFIMVGVAAPWYPLKGMNDYFALNEILSDDYKIIMIGLSKEQINQLPKGIIGIERTNSQTELVEYYSMADCTLNLSYQETFGMTTVEGMACGTPGIVYDKTASPELITEATGFVIKAGDIDSIYTCVNKMHNELFKAHHTDECVKRVRSEFDKERQFAKYINLYNSLI